MNSGDARSTIAFLHKVCEIAGIPAGPTHSVVWTQQETPATLPSGEKIVGRNERRIAAVSSLQMMVVVEKLGTVGLDTLGGFFQ